MSSNPEIDMSSVPAEFAPKVMALYAAMEQACKMHEASKADTKALKEAMEDANDSLLLYLKEINAKNPLFDQA